MSNLLILVSVALVVAIVLQRSDVSDANPEIATRWKWLLGRARGLTAIFILVFLVIVLAFRMMG